MDKKQIIELSQTKSGLKIILKWAKKELREWQKFIKVIEKKIKTIK